jgi:hypothetical protein
MYNCSRCHREFHVSRIQWLCVMALLCLPGLAPSQDPALAPYAVVRIKSHGVSATVIETSQGHSLILGCAHAYWPRKGEDMKSKHMIFDVPAPAGWQGGTFASRVLKIDDKLDLSLVELNTGPLPYVSPVAPDGFRSQTVLSVGYDEMKLPATIRPAHLVNRAFTGEFDDLTYTCESGSAQRTAGGRWRIQGPSGPGQRQGPYEGSGPGRGTGSDRTLTKERPWHGRSGGGLIDVDAGFLIGVCSGYSGPHTHVELVPGGQGIYVSLDAIHRFLRGAGSTRPPYAAAPRPANPRPCPGGH